MRKNIFGGKSRKKIIKNKKCTHKKKFVGTRRRAGGARDGPKKQSRNRVQRKAHETRRRTAKRASQAARDQVLRRNRLRPTPHCNLPRLGTYDRGDMIPWEFTRFHSVNNLRPADIPGLPPSPWTHPNDVPPPPPPPLQRIRTLGFGSDAEEQEEADFWDWQPPPAPTPLVTTRAGPAPAPPPLTTYDAYARNAARQALATAMSTTPTTPTTPDNFTAMNNQAALYDFGRYSPNNVPPPSSLQRQRTLGFGSDYEEPDLR